MKTTEATFNEEQDGFSPIVEGTYPANITSFESRSYNESIVFNLNFTVADEVKKLDVPKLVKDSNGGFVQSVNSEGNPATINASYMAGNQYKLDKGIWLTPKPAQGEGWKNRRYKEFFESLGVEFPKDDNDNTILGEIEEKDVLGVPCLIELRETMFTNKEGQERKAMKVTNAFPWPEGQKLSKEELEEEVPF